MSTWSKPIKKLADRFRTASARDGEDKYDGRPTGGLDSHGSPVSPARSSGTGLSGPSLTPTTASPNTSTTSCNSSSSGSPRARTDPKRIPKKQGAPTINRHPGGLHSPPPPHPPRSNGVPKPAHVRSKSTGSCLGPVKSPVDIYPRGNIVPSGRVTSGMAVCRPTTAVFNPDPSLDHGYGSIMPRSSGLPKPAIETEEKRGFNNDAEECKRIANDRYRKGHFREALDLYDKAISIAPNAAYYFNKSSAFMAMKRLVDAVKQCEEAVRLDPTYVKAHRRLGSLYLSLGQTENARKHICFKTEGHPPNLGDLRKLQIVEKHITECFDSRRSGDWKNTLKEADALISSGVDSSPQISACRAEALLMLHRIEEAFSSVPSDRTSYASPSSRLKIFEMDFDAYPLFVTAHVELSMGKFDDAIATMEKAKKNDPYNLQISNSLNKMELVARARARGNELFKSERFTEASFAYGEGIRLYNANPVLYCNRAACWFMIGQLERSLSDCEEALRFHPNHSKSLLRRAAACRKLERWSEAVRDYEVLRREFPGDKDIAESLFHVQIALKKSRGEEVRNMTFGGEVESVLSLEQFRAAISSPGACVVYFMTASSEECKQVSSVLDTLCTRYPSAHFLKVNIKERPEIVRSENVIIIPSFKIYKNGKRVKELVSPSAEVLESSVSHYSI